jgi:hypothetical protein
MVNRSDGLEPHPRNRLGTFWEPSAFGMKAAGVTTHDDDLWEGLPGEILNQGSELDDLTR